MGGQLLPPGEFPDRQWRHKRILELVENNTDSLRRECSRPMFFWVTTGWWERRSTRKSGWGAPTTATWTCPLSTLIAAPSRQALSPAPPHSDSSLFIHSIDFPFPVIYYTGIPIDFI
jgi:hypothetical protein